MNLQLQKVIEGLKHHGGIAEWGCWKDSGEEYNFEKPPVKYCPYYDVDSDELTCSQKVMSDAIKLLKEYDSALRGMVYQYCVTQKQFLKGKDCGMPNQEVFFHGYTSAGEEAFKVLGIQNGAEPTEDFVWNLERRSSGDCSKEEEEMKNELHPMNDICPYCGGQIEPMFEERNVGPFGVLVGLKCSCCGTEGPKVWLNKRMLKTNEILSAIVTEASFEGMFVPDEMANDEEEA